MGHKTFKVCFFLFILVNVEVIKGLFMKKLLLLSVLVLSGFVFAGCGKQQNQQPAATRGPATSTEKVGDTTKTGVISFSDGRYFLAEAGQTPKEIDSYAVDLSQYVGQTVTVTGQYSGDTLFVGSIQ